MWPSATVLRIYKTKVSILKEYAGLFEIHVNREGHARLLLRLRWGGQYTDRFEIIEEEVEELRCPRPRGGTPRRTKSVAMWRIGNSRYSNFAKGGRSVPTDLADAIRRFLQHPPRDFALLLTFVVGYFGNDANW